MVHMVKKTNADVSSFDKADKTRLKTLLKSLRDNLITGYANYLDYSNSRGNENNIVVAVDKIDETIDTLSRALKYS